jgi:hypothetical protein
MKTNGTAVYQRQHKRGLTTPQLSAIDLLASGKTAKETAELLKLSRTCVTRWCLYDPVFQATLNQRRAEVWGAGIDRLRSLFPKALDALADELENRDSPNRLKAAAEVLRLAQLPAHALMTGPTDPEEIVRQVVERRRKQARGPLDDLIDNDKAIPPFERHMAETWQELEALASKPDEPAPEEGNALPGGPRAG